MFSETTCKVLGFIALVIIGSYIFRIIINYNKNNNQNTKPTFIEGLSSKDEDDDTMTEKEIAEFKDFVDKIKKTSVNAKNKIKLNAPRIREMYEDMLRYTDSYVGAKILENITLYAWASSQKGSKAGEFEEEWLVKFVKKTNMMSEFQQTIKNNLTEWLDNQDSSEEKSLAW